MVFFAVRSDLGFLCRQVEKSGEHAPGTPKLFPRNTQGKFEVRKETKLFYWFRLENQ